MMKNKLTMAHVAKLAEVSIATISRFYTQPSRVSLGAKIRITQAVRQLGYIHRRMKDIDIRPPLIIDNENSLKTILVLYHNAFDHDELFSGFEESASSGRYKLLYFCFQNINMENSHLIFDSLIQRIEGILLVNCSGIIVKLEEYLLYLPPIVIVNEYSPHYSCIYFDHLSIGFYALNYLKRQGHQNIACILDRTKNVENHYLKTGYYQSLIRGGITFLPERIIVTKNSIYAGMLAYSKLMHQPCPPTAIICHDEKIAIGVIYQAQKVNVKIPQQLAVITLNQSSLCKYYNPTISSIGKPLKNMGKKSFQILLQHIQNPKLKKQSILMGFELVVRQSSL